MNVVIINGPNINYIGQRDEKHYGVKSYLELCNWLMEYAKNSGINLECFQSNHEGEIIDRLQQCLGESVDYLIVNLGGYTHTSIAISDCLAMLPIPKIEVHLSAIHSREEYRQKSFISEHCIGQISGFKEYSYRMALDYIILQEAK